VSAQDSLGSPDHGGDVADAKSEAQEILSEPIFNDPGPQESTNWIGSAAEFLANKIGDMIEALLKRFSGADPDFNPAFIPPGVGSALIWIVIAIISAVVLGLVIYLLSRAKWAKRAAKSGGGGLLDDDEPDRSADEWLAEADALAAAGDYRRAVRCLYLACLMRLDENHICEFRRWETNWEHLYRIESSPAAPESLNYRKLTQRFDLIWYGHRTKGASDVDEFRSFYVELVKLLKLNQEAA
jgi:hypothetical protein